LSLIEIVILVILLLILLVAVIALGRISKLAAPSDDSQLIRIETRITDIAFQSGEREKAIRAEFKENREELNKAILALGDTVRKLGSDHGKDQALFRDKLDEKMKELRTENSQKLDEMRKTVDEKLQTTLEKRLSESFKTVSERLEQVHKGLGEMQTLATGVGDLKRVLTNVKSRGAYGEVQLSLLIEDFLTVDQFIVNYDCGKKSGTQRVEFGIRMPGAEARYLPVDSKFPTEDYERLLSAVESGEKAAFDAASNALVRQIKLFAKDISQKYINPPHTTDEAILFLPTEGLYAEVLRSPGLIESLQRDFSVTVSGPTNFQVLLSTFRMGYQQAVMQKHAVEVWKILGAVKREFGNYGEQIAAMGKNVKSMENHIGKLETRKKAMLRALNTVDEVEEETARVLLGDTDSDT